MSGGRAGLGLRRKDALHPVYDAGLGITVGNGNIVFDPANSSNVVLTTPRGTAVYVYGGSIALNEHTVFTVTSKIAQNYTWATDQTDGSNSPNIYNGIYISGGSLYANGTLNVTHYGVSSDAVDNNNWDDNNFAFLRQQVKSFAVRIEQSGNVVSSANIANGEIINQIYNQQETGSYWNPSYTEDGGGGGIYVGGGNVYLGATYSYSDGEYVKSANADNIQVSTTGTVINNPNDTPPNIEEVWRYDQIGTGGHAVEVSGGSLTVYGGTYSAAQGNGILVRNTSNSVANVTIENGTFIGRNGGSTNSDKKVGPGVYYGLYVVGGNLNVVINNGTFGELEGESNSAAAFYGMSGFANMAKVQINKGKFNASDADAISVFRYTTVYFGNEETKDHNGDITVSTTKGDAAHLTLQDDLIYNDGSHNDRWSDVYIYKGTFTGGAHDPAYGVENNGGYSKFDNLYVYGGIFNNGRTYNHEYRHQ